MFWGVRIWGHGPGGAGLIRRESLTQPNIEPGERVQGDYRLAPSLVASLSSSVLTVVKFDSSLLFSNTIVSSQ